MALWKIVGGPREFDRTEDGADIDVGWAWDIEPAEGGERRTVRVLVAGGRAGSSELPEECRRAVQTQGRSALQDVLDREDPPGRLMVSTGGIAERD